MAAIAIDRQRAAASAALPCIRAPPPEGFTAMAAGITRVFARACRARATTSLSK